jgi:hypothetical protein
MANGGEGRVTCFTQYGRRHSGENMQAPGNDVESQNGLATVMIIQGRRQQRMIPPTFSRSLNPLRLALGMELKCW